MVGGEDAFGPVRVMGARVRATVKLGGAPLRGALVRRSGGEAEVHQAVARARALPAAAAGAVVVAGDGDGVVVWVVRSVLGAIRKVRFARLVGALLAAAHREAVRGRLGRILTLAQALAVGRHVRVASLGGRPAHEGEEHRQASRRHVHGARRGGHRETNGGSSRACEGGARGASPSGVEARASPRSDSRRRACVAARAPVTSPVTSFRDLTLLPSSVAK